MCSGKKHNSTGSCKEDTKVSFIRECVFLVRCVPLLILLNLV